ncbi:urease accessory protein UreE [uncultured Albimonas sp.]|uniref:urease accessory protein UreE n=1 Tax=uncultured Albimonas sp. TaxID=1331701 RepID=UPI0030EBD030|tara:strand:+ start:1696 stop:2211 length:516 start_codon:yes stop_codon:yes gene_type:complete
MTQPSAPPPRALTLEPLAGPAADSLSLPYEGRWRRRGLLTTDGGEEILLDLAEATELAEGLALTLGDGRRVALRAAPEPLAEARARDARGLARLAWHIGNRHTPCEVQEGRLLIRRDHVLEHMLEHLGAAVAHVEEPFRPEGGAYGHGRTHGHAHGHDPHHDPDAHLRDPA